MALRADDVDLERDRDLVERYQAGDPEAFDDLYRRYFGRLRTFCQRHTRDAHAAEEIAQEAFVRAFRAMPDFSGERRFYPWMTVIARRLCIDHHRRHSRVEPTDDIDLGSVAPDLDHIDAAVDRAHLEAALDRLGPRHREVLDHRERRGLTYQQIADELDVPVTTVEALLHRARKALRREFAIASGERRGLLGLPLLAWLARRAHDLRVRFADRVPEVSSVAAPIAAAAAAAFVVLPSQAPADDPPPDPVQSVSTVDMDVLPTEPPPTVPDPPPTTEEPPVADTPAPTVATPPPPTVDAGPVDLYVGEEGRAEAERRRKELPTQSEVGPAGAGVDLETVVDDLRDAIWNPPALAEDQEVRTP